MEVDLMKAFDSDSWDFLRKLLVAMWFSQKLITWINNCFSSPWYSVAINGSLVGFFKGERRLRQGDPLSQYLFVLAMEICSQLLNKSSTVDQLKFHPKCKSLGVTHLCFADDVMIFTYASLPSFLAIKRVLQNFKLISGLQANLEKIEVFFGGVSQQQISEALNITGFALGTLPVRYLGIPLISGKLSKADCRLLTEKITSRINSWTSKSFS